MGGYSLRLYSNVLAGAAFGSDLTTLAKNWRRSIRAQGGYWQGSFQIEGDLTVLQEIFYKTLGHHLEEKSGGIPTWEGLLYEMDLVSGGVRRRRSLDLMANRVRSRYISTIGEVDTTTWATNAPSIARYGQREEQVRLDGFPQAAAEARRDTVLKEHAWPWPRPVSARRPRGGPRLEVSVCGYVFTANWRYVTAQDGNTGNVDAWLSSIVGTDCEFLSGGSIASNSLQVKRTLELDQRAWDTMLELTELGDASGNLWRIYVEGGRHVSYKQIDTTPRYILRAGDVYSSIGERTAVNPWQVQPAVMRDALYPVQRAEPGAFLADVRDIWVEEVEVSAARGLVLKTNLFSEEEVLTEQQEYALWLERQEKDR